MLFRSKVVQEAAKHKISINAHEPIIESIIKLYKDKTELKGVSLVVWYRYIYAKVAHSSEVCKRKGAFCAGCIDKILFGERFLSYILHQR